LTGSSPEIEWRVDAVLARHLEATLEIAMGNNNVVVAQPVTGSDDYSVYIEQGVPSLFFRLGAADKDKLAQAKASGKMIRTGFDKLQFGQLVQDRLFDFSHDARVQSRVQHGRHCPSAL